MPREFRRSDRLASQIQREMADLVRIHVKDPELGMITVSDVEVSRDLAVAKVYVSFLGGRLPANETLKHLAEYVPDLRRELGKRIHIRVLPEVRFLYDDSVERGMRMDALLDRLSHETPKDGGEEQNS